MLLIKELLFCQVGWEPYLNRGNFALSSSQTNTKTDTEPMCDDTNNINNNNYSSDDEELLLLEVRQCDTDHNTNNLVSI